MTATTFNASNDLKLETFDSPLGELLLVGARDTLVGVYFPDHRPQPATLAFAQPPASDDVAHCFEQVRAQLEEYFDGTRTTFDINLDARGTAFQQRVWDHLRKLSYGSTCTYGQLASELGQPSAARAVANAVARNPMSIIIPCHRVVGASGSLVGYAGGTARKRWLLSHEDPQGVVRTRIAR